MERISWIADDKASMLKSLVTVGQMLTYINGTLITPLEVIANSDVWSGDPDKVAEIHKKAEEAIADVKQNLENLKLNESIASEDLESIRNSADNDSEIVFKIMNELDILPCVFVLDYDKEADTDKLKVGMQPAVEAKLAESMNSFIGVSRKLGEIWWYEDYMTFLGHVAQVASIPIRIPRLFCALMVQGALMTDDKPVDITTNAQAKEALETLSMFNTIFSADIADLMRDSRGE